MSTLFISVYRQMISRGINEDVASAIAGDITQMVEEKFTPKSEIAAIADGVENLTKYDLEEIRGCGEYDHIMTEQAEGEYVKFADVVEALSTSHKWPTFEKFQEWYHDKSMSHDPIDFYHFFTGNWPQ